jgi:hypothetical protein
MGSRSQAFTWWCQRWWAGCQAVNRVCSPLIPICGK